MTAATASGNRTKAQILKGFRDYPPERMLLRQRIIGIFRDIFERHGFEPLDTPVLEYLEILTGKAGENEKLMYHFADQGGREIGMRYDLTVPLARFVAMHQHEIVMPFKRYHIAPVWRAEKPQRGRFREFWQCDADIVGTRSMAADAEGIAILVEAVTAVGLPQAIVRVNHRGLLTAMAIVAGVDEDRAGMVYRTIDKLDKIGPDGVKRLFIESGVTELSADRVLTMVMARGAPSALLEMLRKDLAGVQGAGDALQDLSELFDVLPDFGVGASSVIFDLSLARGLDYYTGPVFEVTVEEPRVGSVAGAGRYDGLIGTFLGREVPATGVSLGLERIIEVVEEFKLLQVPAATADVFVVVFAGATAAAARLANELRGHGVNVDLSLLDGKGVGEQLKYAGRRGIPLAVIAGPIELSAGRAAVKDLQSGLQEEFPVATLGESIRARLGDRHGQRFNRS